MINGIFEIGGWVVLDGNAGESWSVGGKNG